MGLTSSHRSCELLLTRTASSSSLQRAARATFAVGVGCALATAQGYEGYEALTNRLSSAPKVLSLFTGVGGLDLGLESAGYEVIGSIEFSSKARDALYKNRPAWPHLVPHDVCEAASMRPASLGLAEGELALISAGPPCQPFSAAAQWAASGRLGMRDNRAETIHAMLDLVESFLPQAVLIENVVGFVQGPSSALSTIRERLDRINQRAGTMYTLVFSVVDCASYGIPQHRRRALIVISREGIKFEAPEFTHTSDLVTAWDAIGSIDPGPVPQLNGRWAGLLPSIPEGENYQWLTSRGGGEEIFGYRTRYWSFLLKLAKDRPSWTISASPGPSTGPFHWDNRPLSTAELLRLQSFPSDWIVVGSHRERVHQIGNATPPLLAEVIGRAILKQVLNRPAQSETLSLSLGRGSEEPPPPRLPIPISSAYRSMVGSHAAHPGPGLGPSKAKEMLHEC